jgi:hypothetical protein
MVGHDHCLRDLLSHFTSNIPLSCLDTDETAPPLAEVIQALWTHGLIEQRQEQHRAPSARTHADH